MKRTSVLSILLIIAFFLPWADFELFSFNGFEIPDSLAKVGRLKGVFNDSDMTFISVSYALYLIPILAVGNLIIGFMETKYEEYIKRSEFYFGLILSILFAFIVGNIDDDLLGFMGSGFYMTLIVSIVGILIKDKPLIPETIKNMSPQSDLKEQLTKLKELREQNLITEEEFQQRKEAVLNRF